jgi:hypothetical protein
MKDSDSSFGRVVGHALDFYREKLGLILIFSIPFFIAFLIPLLLPSPTYLALGGVYIRGGSIPTMSMLDWVFTAAAYLVSIFIIADSMVNVNLLIRSKRTMTNISAEVLEAMGRYATRVFLVSIILSLVLTLVFLLLYENPMQSIAYPLLSLILMVPFFFSVPAIVMDNHGTLGSLRASFSVAVSKPLFVLLWLAIAFVLFMAFGIVAYIFPKFLTQYVFLLFNSVFILPFLLILSAQMYMEKYPLAR